MAMSSPRAGAGVSLFRREAGSRPLRFLLRSLEYQLLAYKRTWRGSLFSSFLNPFLYLAAMGVGLGSLVDSGQGAVALGGLSYLEFLAPAMLAAISMQVAAAESTYPVYGAWRWHKSYYAMVATPLRPIDVFTGHLMFVALRLVQTAVLYVIVIALFGTISSPWGIATVGVGVLVGLAFATPTFALSMWVNRDTIFSVYMRFIVLPMFLFSGAFFPIEQLPDVVEPVAYALPLWHGVELCRAFASGRLEPLAVAVHLGYLLLWVLVGFVLAARAYRRRLIR